MKLETFCYQKFPDGLLKAAGQSPQASACCLPQGSPFGLFSYERSENEK